MDHLVDAQGAMQCQGSNTNMHRQHSAHRAVLLPCNFFYIFFGKVHNLWYWSNTDAVLLRSGSGYFWDIAVMLGIKPWSRACKTCTPTH